MRTSFMDLSITSIDPSHFYLIRFPFLGLDLLDSHCYASCAAVCCHSADAEYFCIDYTSGISSNANATLCVFEVCIEGAVRYKDQGLCTNESLLIYCVCIYIVLYIVFTF